MILKYISDSTHNNTYLLEFIAHLMFFILYIFCFYILFMYLFCFLLIYEKE